MISAIFFDYDGVLTTDKTGSITTCRYVSRATGIDLSAVQVAFLPHNEELTLGRKTHVEIWPAICRTLGRDLRFSLLQEAFESTPINAGMFSLARSLKGKYPLGIITDNKKERVDHLRSFQRLELLFDPIVVSSEVDSSKRTEKIFRVALQYWSSTRRPACSSTTIGPIYPFQGRWECGPSSPTMRTTSPAWSRRWPRLG